MRKTNLPSVIAVAALLLLWQAVCSLGVVPRYMLPSPAQVVQAFVSELPLLFERFHKSDKSRSEDKDGVGLGLYIVKTILEQHKEKAAEEALKPLNYKKT